VRRAGTAWLVAGLLWFLLEALAAQALPGYSYAHNYISDLGIPSPATFQGRAGSSPLALVMNANFIVHGTLFLTGAVFAFRASGRGTVRFVFLAFALANAAGNLLVATIHNSAQAAANGSIALHGLGAALAIYGADIAIVVAGASAGRLGATASYRIASVALGVVGILSISHLVAAPATAVPAGAWERLGVYPIMTWEIMTGLVILLSNRRAALDFRRTLDGTKAPTFRQMK
jgi:hypothetical membrane protein